MNLKSLAFILSLFSIHTFALGKVNPHLPFGVERVYSLNQVEQSECNETINNYEQGSEGHYACERVRKVLYAVDLTKVENGKEGEEPVKIIGDENGKEDVLTSYVVQPPLEEVKRGIDWGSADKLVRSAFSNLTTDVWKDEAQTHKIPNHGIGHAFSKVECNGLPPIFTGMTTADDLESPKNFFVHNFGLGILFRTQKGRFNSYKELDDEVNDRAESVGNIRYVRYKLSPENCKYVYYSVIEAVAEGIQKKYGSLTDRLYHGTGMGCAMFEAGLKQIAQVIPEGAASENEMTREEQEAKGVQCKFYREWKRTVYLPQDLLPQKVNEYELGEAKVGLLSLLFSGDNSDGFIGGVKKITEMLFKPLREGYDVGGTLDLGPDVQVNNINETISTLGGLISKIEGLLSLTGDGSHPASGTQAILRKAAHRGVQKYLNGELDVLGDGKPKKFLNETFAVKPEGYDWSTSADSDATKLEFWDPQKYADWISGLRRDIIDQEFSGACGDVKRLYRVHDKIARDKDGNFDASLRDKEGNLGLEIDWSHIEPPRTSFYFQYDNSRANDSIPVDKFEDFDKDGIILQR